MSTPSRRTTFGVLASAARAWAGFPGLAGVALSALVLKQVFFTAFAYSLKWVVEDVTGHHSAALTVLLVMLVLGFAVAVVATVVGERASAHASARIVNAIRADLYDHLLRLSPAYFLVTPAGRVLDQFSANLRLLEGGYIAGFLGTAIVGLSTLITVPVLFLLDWRLAALVCVTMPLVVVLVDRLLPRSVAANNELSAADLDIATTVQDTMRAEQVIRTFHLADLLRRRFGELLERQERRSVRARVIAATVAQGASLGVILVQVMVLVVGAELASSGAISVGTLVGFVTVLGMASKNVYDFARVDLPRLAEAGRGAVKIDSLLTAPVVVTDPEDKAELPVALGDIAFHGVSFSYTPGRPALDDVTFHIEPRQRVALVGRNGSGKSTVINLLMRFYDPESGTVSIDQRSLREVTQISLRSQISAVLQGNFIFNDTIRENIRIGAPEATDDDVVRASRLAELHEYVSTLPHGYDTVVGEAGGRLSGGHRQRLAVARALIRNPRVLLLDEVTTALDPATEAALTHTLDRLANERTTIAATHRLRSAQTADFILVFDGGKLVESGTHAQLHAANGTYRDLWDKQSGFDVSLDGRQATVDAARLRGITLFADLDDRALGAIAAELVSEYYEPDQTVFHQGDPGDRFYLIARGRVDVVTVDAAGEHRLDVLGDGDHFGELALLRDRPRTATIRTIAPSVLLTMSRSAFLTLVAETPEMSRALEERMARSELNLDEWRRLVGRQVSPAPAATDGEV